MNQNNPSALLSGLSPRGTAGTASVPVKASIRAVPGITAPGSAIKAPGLANIGGLLAPSVTSPMPLGSPALAAKLGPPATIPSSSPVGAKSPFSNLFGPTVLGNNAQALSGGISPLNLPQRAPVIALAPRPAVNPPIGISKSLANKNQQTFDVPDDGDNSSIWMVLLGLLLLGLIGLLVWMFWPSYATASVNNLGNAVTNVPTVNITGNWSGYSAQNVKTCYAWRIVQSGSSLHIFDANMPSIQTTGTITSDNKITAPLFNLTGTLSADQKRIDWSDSTYWLSS